VANTAVDWSDMLGLSSSSPPRATEVSSSRWPQIALAREECGLELANSSLPRPRGPGNGLSLRGARPAGRPRGAERPALSGRPTEADGGADDSNSPYLRWLRPPRCGLLEEAPVTGEVDAERTAGGRFRRCPVAPSIIAYPGWRSPGRSCFPRRWRGAKDQPQPWRRSEDQT
jgi:hypothetical protein